MLHKKRPDSIESTAWKWLVIGPGADWIERIDNERNSIAIKNSSWPGVDFSQQKFVGRMRSVAIGIASLILSWSYTTKAHPHHPHNYPCHHYYHHHHHRCHHWSLLIIINNIIIITINIIIVITTNTDHLKNLHHFPNLAFTMIINIPLSSSSLRQDHHHHHATMTSIIIIIIIIIIINIIFMFTVAYLLWIQRFSEVLYLLQKEISNCKNNSDNNL